MKKQNKSQMSALRQKAEEFLGKVPGKSIAQLSEADINKLLHELQVHKIELQMQMEELALAKEQAVIAAEKYTELYDFAPSGYFTLSRKGEILQLNLSGAIMLVTNRSLLINKLFHLFVSESSKPTFRLFLENVFSNREKKSCELTLSIGNMPIDVYITGAVAVNGDHCHITAIDITSRKQAETLLKVSEEKYHAIFNNVQDIFYQTDLAGTVLEVSPSIENILGFGRNEIIGKPFSNLSFDFKSKDMFFYKLNENGKLCDYELRLKTKTGELKFTSINTRLIFDANGKPHHIDGAIRDITDRKMAEKSLAKKDVLLNITGHTAKVGGWEIDVETLIQTWTDEVYAIHEIDKSFIPDVKNGIGFYAPWSKPFIENAVFEALDYGKNFDLELEFITKKGRHLWVRSIGETVQVNGKTTKVYGSIQNITDRKQTEAELDESREFNKLLLSTIPMGMDIVDEQGNILYLSNTLKQHFGEGALGKKCWELYRDDQTQCKDCPLLGGISIGETNVYETSGVLGGKVFEISHTGMMFNGNKAMLEIFVDITERKQAEETLRKNIALQTKMVSNIGDVIVIIDQDGINRYKSPNIKTLFGWQPEELLGKNTLDIVHPDDLKPARKFINSIAAKPGAKGTTEIRYMRKDGKYVWIAITFVNLLADPDIKGLLGNYHDITERRNSEDALRKSESEFRLLAESMPQIVWITSPDGSNIFFNKQWVDYTGLSMEESYGTGWNKPFHPDDQQRAWDAWQNATTNLANYSLKCRLRRFDGEYKWWLIRGVPVMGENGKVAKWFGTCTDIDEMKLLETELIIAKEHAEESDRLKSAFLANMSHEIRTPMNGILGFTELLREPELAEDQQKYYISIIEKSGARLLNIINNIMDISKIESGLMKPSFSEINANEYLENIFAFFNPEAETRNIKLICSAGLPVEEAFLNTDGEKFYAILLNLVKNALKYTETGFIEFGYNRVETGHALSLPNQSYLQFYIKDTGIGIPKNRQEAIFERFVQADILDKMARQGAGLGLSISKAYVEMLGGKIWVESEEDNLSTGKSGGSTFYFTLSISANPESENTVKIINPAINVQVNPEVLGLKILIAEDDEPSCEFISIGARKFGKEVIKVLNGREAVDTCRNSPDIDLILMDIQMPELNGYDATRQIRQFNTEVIIIALTAYALAGDREKTIEAGCNDYISKPIKMVDLVGMIQKYFKV
jgi:PAS domain S-box-containing protein